jgi:hypothetical protein
LFGWADTAHANDSCWNAENRRIRLDRALRYGIGSHNGAVTHARPGQQRRIGSDNCVFPKAAVAANSGAWENFAEIP